MMEALSCRHCDMESGFLLYDWSGYVNEIGDAIDTSLAGLSLLMTFLATLSLV